MDWALASLGRPMPAELRQDMEQGFGHDFSGVRIHTDTSAEKSARDVKAHAYTVEKGIVFGGGRFALETQEGRHLLAHELTHVVQQGAAAAAATYSAAKTAGNGATEAGDVRTSRVSEPGRLQRKSEGRQRLS